MRGAALVALVATAMVPAGCSRRRAEYEFLAMPRAGLAPGLVWKQGIGPLSGRPERGARITRRARGVDWLRRQGRAGVGGGVNAALGDFFAVGLGLERKHVVSVQALGLVHRRVAGLRGLGRGQHYLWETVEADRIRVAFSRELAGSLDVKIREFGRSEAGRRAALQFWPVAGSDHQVYEVTGRNLVVAVKVVSLRGSTQSRPARVGLGRRSQDQEQACPFGYRLLIGSGDVELMRRRFRAVVWNPKLAAAGESSLQRTISSRPVELYSGAVQGAGCDAVTDRAHVSHWDFDGLRCRVIFDRTRWMLEPADCGLDTVE
jgi:hypothetical protein